MKAGGVCFLFEFIYIQRSLPDVVGLAFVVYQQLHIALAVHYDTLHFAELHLYGTKRKASARL